MERLALFDPRGARVVELRVFGGLSVSEAAHLLGVSKRTVYRDIRDLERSGVPIRGEAGVGYRLERGFEVIYTGLRQSPEQIAREAIQEDVDAVGLSILSGAHLALTGKVLELLRDQGAEDIPVLVGGLIPEQDKDRLRELGVAGVFTAGTHGEAIQEAIRAGELPDEFRREDIERGFSIGALEFMAADEAERVYGLSSSDDLVWFNRASRESAQ